MTILLNFLIIVSQETESKDFVFLLVVYVLGFIVFVGIIILILRFVVKFIEGFYFYFIASKPLFRHFYFLLKKLEDNQKRILRAQFIFYKRLNEEEKKYFEHRVSKFIKQTTFLGKDNLDVTEEMELLVSATAIMLTFGYRDYNIELVDKVLLYPDTFFSNTNKDYHNGEFNAGYKAIVLSWKHFKEGYNISNDNLNLGIHEFTHAMHFSYLSSQKNNDISAATFLTAYDSLTEFFEQNDDYKKELVHSNLLRDYAYTNHYEFLAVIIETFIESPIEFKSQFPEIYNKIKQMLNFNFPGY